MYKAKEFGDILGGNMHLRKEIYKRGPVGCGIQVTQRFLAYSGGIYSEGQDWLEPNHELSLVGFGKDPKTGEVRDLLKNNNFPL